MRLKLSVRRGAGERHDLMVTADATAKVGDVAAALMTAHPTNPATPVDPASVTLRIQDGTGPGRTIDTTASLIDSGVRSGMLVEVVRSAVPVSKDRGAVAALLRIIAGTGAGKEIQLPFGSSVIGRSTACDVVLDDQMVSKTHARITVGDGIEVIDQNSANGVLVGGQQVGRIRIGPDDVVTLGDTQFTVVQVRRPGVENLTTTDIPFTRSPSVLPRLVERVIELPAAPKPAEKQPFPWIAMVAPLLMGAVMLGLNQPVTSLIFVALSPIIMLGTWLDHRIRTTRKLNAEIANFEQNLSRARRDLTAGHDQDRADLITAYPSVLESWDVAARLGPVLWWRRPEHPQFLQLRLGLGPRSPLTTAERKTGNDGLAEFEDQLAQVVAEFSVLRDAPIVADLRSYGALGLCGPRDVLDGVARGVLVQLICMHSPAEVVVACLTSGAGLARWDWLRWTPHTSSPHSPLAGLHLASDPATGGQLLSQLEELVDQRAEAGKAPKPRGPLERDERIEPPVLPSVVVLVDDPLVDLARLTRVAERGPDVGVHMIWCAAQRAAIPATCRVFLEVGTSGSRVGLVRQGDTVVPVAVESIAAANAERLGRILSPVLDAGVPADDASDLPKSVTLVSLTGQDVATSPEAVVARWRENQSIIDRREGARAQSLKHPVSLRALVGHAGTEPFTLDLRTQGPHALVGGTTGSGKSEFLQAWVLGLAAAHSPDRVTFLFVDYKGGSAFAKCVELPHFVGIVTDLTPYLVRRALTSLRAELRHREHLLNDKGAKDLAELEKRGDPECPPSLVIVVDEFAALVGEVPEFVDGVVDVAQRGRSLGLHLILATQRPAGVIKDNLRANTNLRVALRMADEHDSQDVLGEKTAAFFDPGTPGRGAAKTGPGRIVQFQSGYPGAKTPQKPLAAPVDVAEMNFGGGLPWRVPERTTNLDDVRTDIERLVSTISAAASASAIPKPRRPWLEGLADVYDLSKLEQRRDAELVLGVMDDPENQDQRAEYFFPDAEGNIAYYGAGGSGKTTALRSLAIAASITPRSGGVHVYGLDFAGGGLSLLEPLPNVGSIIDGSDDERIARLFRWLRSEADERSARYRLAKATTITEYRRNSGRTSEPRILVLIDGIGAFKAEYEGSTDRLAIFAIFQQLLVDGRGVGIHFALTADRPAALPASLASSFQRKVVLRQTDDDGYRYLGLPRDVLAATSPPGRTMQVGRPQELQLAILGDNVNVAAQSRLIEQLADWLRTIESPRPQAIGSLPKEVPAAGMPSHVRDLPVLGLADETLAPVPFSPLGAALIWGPQQSGRTNAMLWLARSLRAWRPDLRIVHLASRRSPLSGLDVWSDSATGVDACEKILGLVSPIVGAENRQGTPSIAVFIESYPEFLSSRVESLLTTVVKAARANDHFVVAEGEASTWNSSWPLLMEIRNARTGLMLNPDPSDGDTVLRTTLPRFRKAPPIPGRGFWVHGGQAFKVQIPRAQ